MSKCISKNQHAVVHDYLLMPLRSASERFFGAVNKIKTRNNDKADGDLTHNFFLIKYRAAINHFGYL